MYNKDAPEDDMMERYEEMNRMREHVMNEVDKDKDSMISFREFIDSTNERDFNEDKGWDVSIVFLSSDFHFLFFFIFIFAATPVLVMSKLNMINKLSVIWVSHRFCINK